MAPYDWKNFLMSFKGRVSRKDFWLRFVVPYYAISIALSLATQYLDPGFMNVMMLFTAVALWPSAAVGVKRWHDRGKSGWWCLSMLIPVLGWIYMFVECGCLRGTRDDNAFGPIPSRS